MGKHTETNEKRKKRKKHTGRNIFLCLLILCVVAGIFLAKRVNELDGNWMALLLGHNKDTLKNLDTIQFLILGESTGMSDTIIVASYNPKTQNASMLSIPRDTYVENGKYKYTAQNKINSLFNGGQTPEKTIQAINKITGLDLKYYILVNTEALTKLVDLIGGLQFDVPADMKYDDSAQNLHINLKKGMQTLTGAQVEQLVRFRHNNDGTSYSYEYGNEDYGRMRTQRDVIVAIAKQTLKFKNIKEIKNLINIMQQYVYTNMSFNLIVDYVPYAININMDNLQTAQLPGKSDFRGGGWFFFHDEEETKQVVDQLFNEPEQEEMQNAEE